jgi:hypothetical protein
LTGISRCLVSCSSSCSDDGCHLVSAGLGFGRHSVWLFRREFFTLGRLSQCSIIRVGCTRHQAREQVQDLVGLGSLLIRIVCFGAHGRGFICLGDPIAISGGTAFFL